MESLSTLKSILILGISAGHSTHQGKWICLLLLISFMERHTVDTLNVTNHPLDSVVIEGLERGQRGSRLEWWGPLFLPTISMVSSTLEVLINISWISEQISEACIHPSSSYNRESYPLWVVLELVEHIGLHSGTLPVPGISHCVYRMPQSPKKLHFSSK